MALIATVTLEIDDNGPATGEPRRFRLKATPTPEATQRALLYAWPLGSLMNGSERVDHTAQI